MLIGFSLSIFIFVVTVVAIVLVAGVDLDPNRKMSPTFLYPHVILAKRVYNLVACITWTARGLSQMQNSMRLKSLYEYMLGVRQWRHVALRHGSDDFAFPVNIDFAADDQRIFMYYSWKAHVFIHPWNNVYKRWITSNLPFRWHRTTSTTSGWKSSIFNRNSCGLCTTTIVQTLSLL